MATETMNWDSHAQASAGIFYSLISLRWAMLTTRRQVPCPERQGFKVQTPTFVGEETLVNRLFCPRRREVALQSTGVQPRELVNLFFGNTMNPIFPGWYADPELHLFAGRYYLYPTYSAPYEEQTFFEVWSSSDSVQWQNEGRILDFADVPWSTNRCAWAPSVIERNGRYFFYFSAGDGAGLGVAVADHPAGPFADALGKPLVATYPHGAQPIDAHAFLDDDGQAYLYFGGWSHAVVAKLNEDMISLHGDFLEITPAHYVEGPFMLKRRGVYYFMWSEGGWGDSSYGVAYAKAASPLGPFVRTGSIMQSDPSVGSSAGHHSVLNLPGTDDWVIAYHRRPLSETDPHHRVVCLDRLYFDDNGDILPVVLTNEGVPAWPL